MSRRHWILPSLMLAGATGGIALGATLGDRWTEPSLEPLVLGVRLMGQVFLSLLKALMIPLVISSIVMAMQAFGDTARGARLAGLTVAYYLATTLLAVITGLLLVQVLHPGHPAAGTLAPVNMPAVRGPLQAVYDIVAGMFPGNLFSAATEGNILGLLVFSLIFGLALARLGAAGRPLVEAVSAANAVLFAVVRWVVQLAPLGILGLAADRLGTAGGGAAAWAELERLGLYSVTVMAGLAIHALVTLPALLALLARRNPFRYLAGMSDALLTAGGTASSAATLAVTLRCAVERNTVSARTAHFVIPIGTTVNMDGTALYEAVAVVFVAQSLGIDLSGTQLLVVALTATLAAVGAAAIPEAGLVTMVLVLTAVNLPAEGIGLILAIDWILDRVRTATNVWGDAVGAAIIDHQVTDWSAQNLA